MTYVVLEVFFIISANLLVWLMVQLELKKKKKKFHAYL